MLARLLAPLLAHRARQAFLAILASASLVSALPGSGAVPVAGQEFADGMLCPSMPEEPALPSIHADWEGQRIYFCCKMCRREFLEDPQPILANLALVGQAPATPSPNEAPSGTDGAGTLPASEEPGATESPASSTAGGSTTEPGAPESRGTVAETPGGDRPGWFDWFGRLHPLAVHFPITLLVLAGVAELLVRSGEGPWRGRARFLLALGAPAAALSAWLGWLAGANANYPGLQDVLFRHRWLGVATAVLALGALAIAPRARERGQRRERLYRWLVFASLLSVVLAGHHGGILVFGPDHLRLP